MTTTSAKLSSDVLVGFGDPLVSSPVLATKRPSKRRKITSASPPTTDIPSDDVRYAALSRLNLG